MMCYKQGEGDGSDQWIDTDESTDNRLCLKKPFSSLNSIQSDLPLNLGVQPSN